MGKRMLKECEEKWNWKMGKKGKKAGDEFKV
jgi:hypothetical protein